jgi:NitT/TauT family transport system ATP-binding protein
MDMEEYGVGASIKIRDVQKVYDPGGIHLVAVDGITFDVGAGEFVVMVGPSGCGKTTLLNAIAGFDTITGGEIYLDGQLIAAPGRQPRPGPDRVVVFQHGALFPWKTVLENVIYGPTVQGKMTRAEAVARARELLHQAGLRDVERAYPRQLSSGAQRRVEVVRALMCDPKVLLLDEPFRALDATSKSVMHEALLRLYDLARKTMFFITHDLDEAVFLADRVVVSTTRPARVKKIVRVNLPRPRTYRVMASPEYRQLKEEVLELVHEEAVKAFERGERELAR